MNEQKKSVTTFHSKKIVESITFKNRVFCVLKVSGATDVLDIIGFQLQYGWILLDYHLYILFLENNIYFSRISIIFKSIKRATNVNIIID